ncbi:MAG: hypothetical protein ABF248_09540, partial [Yoonia sp.]
GLYRGPKHRAGRRRDQRDDLMAKGESLAAQFDGAFDTDAFVRDVIVDLHDLELKARINHIAVILAGYLPQDFEVAAKVIHNALSAPLNPDLTVDDFGFYLCGIGCFRRKKGA